jgi:Trk K+ transport system NAD-binding subunit
MKRNRFIIVGVGNVGAGLLEMLPRDIDILCIDNAPGADEKAKKIRGDGVRVIAGDATSRLVLEEAGVNDADCVIISTTKEKISLEVATLLKEHFSPKRVISVGITNSGIQKLDELGAEVQNIFTITAAGIRNLLEHKTKTAHSIGIGKNEILEVEVHPNSRLVNKPIGSVAPLRWNIGIIYRDGNIIVPKRGTVLKPKDKVVILGDPAVLKTVSEILTFNFERFPLEYGATVLAFLEGGEDERYFEELEYLFSIFPLNKIVFVYSGKAVGRSGEFARMIKRESFRTIEEQTLDLPFDGAVDRVLQEASGEYGIIAVPRGALSTGPLRTAGKKLLKGLSVRCACPILVLQGTHPYEKIAVPAVQNIEVQRTIETALEIATSLNTGVSALLTRPSAYISTPEDVKSFESLRKTISQTSLMYKTNVETPILQGNPVTAVLAALSEYNLLLIDAGTWKKQGWMSSLLNPDVMWHIVKRSPVSTLLIPPIEESL